VDDEPDILASYAELIESMTGARALQATSGRAAIPLMQANTVDLVVSDFNMPGMDGITFLSLCKDRWPGARRILVTAFETDTLQQRARHEARIHGFLSKSGDPDSFLDGLQAALAG